MKGNRKSTGTGRLTTPAVLSLCARRRFAISKSVRLNALTDAKEYSTSDEFKVSFSFSGDRLLVPWITITDGKAHYVEAIDFYFQYSQGFVNHVKWKTTCQFASASDSLGDAR